VHGARGKCPAPCKEGGIIILGGYVCPGEMSRLPYSILPDVVNKDVYTKNKLIFTQG